MHSTHSKQSLGSKPTFFPHSKKQENCFSITMCVPFLKKTYVQRRCNSFVSPSNLAAKCNCYSFIDVRKLQMNSNSYNAESATKICKMLVQCKMYQSTHSSPTSQCHNEESIWSNTRMKRALKPLLSQLALATSRAW